MQELKSLSHEPSTNRLENYVIERAEYVTHIINCRKRSIWVKETVQLVKLPIRNLNLPQIDQNLYIFYQVIPTSENHVQYFDVKQFRNLIFSNTK